MNITKKIWIIVPVFNRSEEIHNFLNQIFSQTYPRFNIVIIDHGTEDIDFSNLCDPRLFVIRRSPRLWWTGAVNSGIKEIIARAAKDDYILIINDDVIVNTDYLENLVTVAENNPNTIIGSICINQETKRVIYANRLFNKASARFSSPHRNQHFNKSNMKKSICKSHILFGRGMLIPVKVIECTGLFNEKWLPHYGADSEFSWRARKQGFKLICAMNCQVFTRKKREGLPNQGKGSFLKFITNKRRPGNFAALVSFSLLCFQSYYAVYFIFLNLIRMALSYRRRFL